jgi:hypothetical protein
MKRTQRTLEERPLNALEAHVLSVMENGESQDAISLIERLAGRPSLLLKSSLLKAYQQVAQDVLNNLQQRGLIRRDEHGWYTKK